MHRIGVDKGVHIGMAVFITFVIGTVAHILLTEEQVTIVGYVTEWEYNVEEKYLTATFDNGKTYRINHFGVDGIYTDLTVNSKMVITLIKHSLWCKPNTQELWSISLLLKLPETEE